MTIYIHDNRAGYLLDESLLACTGTRPCGGSTVSVDGDLLLYARYFHNSTRFHLLNGNRDFGLVHRNINEQGHAEPIVRSDALDAVLARPNGYLLLCNTWENFPIHDPQFQYNLAALVEFVGLPARKVIISCCDASAGPCADPRAARFKAIGMDWVYLREKVSYDPAREVALDAAKLKHFIFLNRRFTDDRFLTLLLLWQSDWLHKAHLSFLSPPAPHDLERLAALAQTLDLFGGDRDELLRRLKGCAAGLPIEIDGSRDSVDWAGGASLLERMREACFFIVHETLTSSKGFLFLSEKTYKPIRHGLPFLVYGGSGILAHLRALGFRTFHPWIDERYDGEQNDAKRLQLFLKEIERIGRMDANQVHHLYRRLVPMVAHNREHLQSRATVDQLQERLGRLCVTRMKPSLRTNLHASRYSSPRPGHRTNHDHAPFFHQKNVVVRRPADLLRDQAPLQGRLAGIGPRITGVARRSGGRSHPSRMRERR